MPQTAVPHGNSYNADNTLASISCNGVSLGTLSYGWDANKNKTKTSETITGTMSGYGFSVETSGYGAEDRLVAWNRSDSNLSQSWALSLMGDWNSITESSSTQYRTHGDAHELLTAASQSLQHDVKGNQTPIPAVLRPSSSDPLSLSWDFDNRLSSADVDNDGTADVTYTFDALGRRVGRNDGPSAMVHVRSGQQMVADYGSGIAASIPTYNYVYANYIDEPVLRDDGTNLRYFHRNQQYNITALTDASGTIVERYAYTAYGQPTFANGSGTVLAASAEDNRYTYTGREWDKRLGLYHHRARMYDADEGRFCSRDPIGFQGDSSDLYAIAGNRPLSTTDPTGMVACTLGAMWVGSISPARAESGGVGAGVGGSTGPAPASGNVVSTVKCVKTRTVTFFYNCVCVSCFPAFRAKSYTVTKVQTQSVSIPNVPVTGGVMLVSTGVTIGPGTGALSASAWIIDPTNGDQGRANTACRAKGLMWDDFGTPTGTGAEFDCPWVPFY